MNYDDYDQPNRRGYDDYDRPNRNRYDDDDYDRDDWRRRERPSHSGLGVISVIIAILSGLGFFVLIAISAAIEVENPGALDDDQSPTTMMLGGGVCFSGFGFVVSLILGIVGLLQPNRFKMFPIIGTVLSIVALLGMAGLMLIGIAAG